MGEDMRFQYLRLICVAAVLAVAACSNASKAPTGSPIVQGESSKPGAFLAYEHAVNISMPAETISGRLTAVRMACTEARFGACSVLRIEEATGEYRGDTLVVRLVPEGVEPMVKFAADSGVVGSRSTKSEDRAEVITDLARKTDLLTKQREKLSEYEARRDLPLTDRLALVRELTSIEQQLDEFASASKNENRRIETNLLTLNFRGNKVASRWSKISTSFSGFFDQFLDGASEVIDVVAYGLPFVLLAFPLALLWRWLWRRVTSKKQH
jgi:hypothetical protein